MNKTKESEACDRVGFYLWSSPTTIKMISLKYFNPRIDSKQILSSYDYNYLKAAKDELSITDVWVSGYWGFSDEIDKQALDFLGDRIVNFKRLGLKVHVYLQGPNLVKSSYPDADWWAKDVWGRNVYYHRGRLVCCVNNEKYLEFAKSRALKLADIKEIDGIYLDNPQMGALGMSIDGTKTNCPGCYCKDCQRLFFKTYGVEFPKTTHALSFEKYLSFRSKLLGDYIESISKIVRSKNKEFGVNVYDPKFDLKYITGCELGRIAKSVDYLMFEVINQNTNKVNNSTYARIAEKLPSTVNVFVLNYQKGIGKDHQLSREYVNQIKHEDSKYTYFECIKGCEYVTGGVWHNLRIDSVGLVSGGKVSSNSNRFQLDTKIRLPKELKSFIGKTAAYVLPYYFNNKIVRNIASVFVSKSV